MRRTPYRALAVATASLSLVAGSLTTAAMAAPGPGDDDVPGAEQYAPSLLRAMERDLGMPAERAVERLEFQASAAERSARAAKTLDSFAGAWVHPASDVLYVAVANRGERARAERLGARAVVVDRTADELVDLQEALDASLADAGVDVTSSYVDPTTNALVVGVVAGDEAAATAAAADAGVPADAVTVVAEEQPRTFIDVVGGNAYYINGSSRCSVGFTVGDGFVTAGHCGAVGATTTNPSGTFAGSSFPGDDYAYVRTASGNTLVGAVNDYAGSTVGVAGSTAAPVGATVCRSGSTTGWHCGTIQAYDATVTYQQGSVHGLIRTTVCAEPGDSGGSLLAGNQAQGVTSGGSGDCRRGGTTYFQPVNEILNRYGLTLRTSGGGGGTPEPTSCSDYERTGSSTLSHGGSAATGAFSAASGTHVGCLDGPSGADFDLYLQRYSSGSWRTVAQGITTSSDELVTYTGTSGTYRWLVRSYSGSGSFTLGWDVP
ncbi:S1 family peptidase [Isoptericola variabilis]|uniref:Alpha-lytic endopeptidase, Aqualysin 1 n=1 Tax=Isoptericola variabilis (strain 225) TaxID=743718 RepID=F6FTL5_ISOV2|nr:S1 family peptidase [Isoptericola variabilis]AEG43208.1 Alpha-lytic endopeptidase, Aqualysin 1 [Isoptericola variabilis 225]TWH35143.1 streptogrisin C [Isoptericola variabilis J7]